MTLARAASAERLRAPVITSRKASGGLAAQTTDAIILGLGSKRPRQAGRPEGHHFFFRMAKPESIYRLTQEDNRNSLQRQSKYRENDGSRYRDRRRQGANGGAHVGYKSTPAMKMGPVQPLHSQGLVAFLKQLSLSWQTAEAVLM